MTETILLYRRYTKCSIIVFKSDANDKPFQIVKGYAEASQNLLKALVAIGKRLHVTQIYAEIYDDSPEFRDCIVDLYSSMIVFWSQALNFTAARGTGCSSGQHGQAIRLNSGTWNKGWTNTTVSLRDMLRHSMSGMRKLRRQSPR